MAKRAQLDEIRPVLNEVNEAVSTAESVIDKVEDVVEVVPEVLEKTVHVTAEGARKGVRVFQSPKVMALTLALGGAAAGAALGVAGYFLLKKKLEKKYQAEMEEKLEAEIDGMRRFYERRTARKQPYSSPEEAAEALVGEDKLVEDAVEALDQYESDQQPVGVQDGDPREGNNHRVRYDKVRPRRPDGKFAPTKQGPMVPVSDERAQAQNELNHAQEEESRNVFRDPARIEGWDQEAEEAARNPLQPYVISHDEFEENAYEHQQNTLTYYAGDDILADEREVHIEDVEGLVGIENLKLFGHGSRDSNVVYIRNERVEIDFEVTLNRGTYAEEVIGLEHSDTPRLRHGRRGDDG